MNKGISGVGVGLRHQHLKSMLKQRPDLPWLELLVDNWLDDEGAAGDYLAEIACSYPVALHGVALNLAGYDPLSFSYLERIKSFKEKTGAVWYSEHACFSQLGEKFFPDLLPLPYTEEAVTHLSQRIRQVQEFLGERILLENVSAYIDFDYSPLGEIEFLSAVAEESDCYLLLDLTNLHVNEINRKVNAEFGWDLISRERVKEIHLAGYQLQGERAVDSHGGPIGIDVFSTYESCLEYFGPLPTLVEWDNDVPVLEKLLTEQKKAEQYYLVSVDRESERREKKIMRCKADNEVLKSD